MIKRILFGLTLIITAFSDQSQAQDYVDLVRFKYANTPLNQFDSSTASTRVEEFILDATLPFLLKNGNAIITGFDLQSLSTNVNPTIPELTSVYTILVKLGMNINFNDKWSGNFLFIPKLSSDLKEISSNDVQYGAIALMKYVKTPQLKYQFGMYYNSELFGPFFVPLLGLYYLSKSKKLEINATLPVWMDINYRLKPWLRAGFSFSAFVRSYNINEPQFAENGEYLVRSSNEPMLYLQFDATENLIIQTKIGYSIGRQYAIYDETDRITFGLSAFRFGDDRRQLNSDFRDGILFEARLFYRFHINKEE